MKIDYKPKNNLEKFGIKVYHTLVENFPQTFFVGGMVRDLLLKRNITDIDIATEAKPDKVAKLLRGAKIQTQENNKKFGSIIAKLGKLEVEITTFRKDLKSKNRYPKVKFITNPKTDSQRRDFTINALYLKQKPFKILDFNQGLPDLKNKIIKFIGKPDARIKEDPLRIIRALRFAKILNFKLDRKTKWEIKNNFSLIKKLTMPRLKKELNKITETNKRNVLKKVINKPKVLDKYFE
jgi:tRNA nucleotidyltransferase (CCA-adding enzyme)